MTGNMEEQILSIIPIRNVPVSCVCVFMALQAADVYKRQGQYKDKCDDVSNCGCIFVLMSEPVSYTHLDVYKRQP